MPYYRTTVASNGSGAGSGTFPEGIRGYLKGIRLEYGGTPDAGTDVTIAEAAADSMERTLLSRQNSGTTATLNPQNEVHKAADGSSASFWEPFYLEGKSTITVTIAQAVINTANAVTVTLLVDND